MTPASYEELNDLPSLVNALRALAQRERFAADGSSIFLVNAATAIEGLMNDRQRLILDANREREARRIIDAALRDALAAVKAANEP